METPKIEETIETKEEEILTPEEVKELEGKTDEELTDEEKKNKKLYARAKTAEDKRKADKIKFDEEKTKLEAKIKELETGKVEAKPEHKEPDPIEFAKQVRKLSTLEDEEISYAQILAKGMSKSVEEVIATDEFKIWSDARKEKIKKDNLSQKPSGRQGEVDRTDPMFEKFSRDLPRGFDFTKK